MFYVPHLIEIVEELMNEGETSFFVGDSVVELRILRDRLILFGDEWIVEDDLKALMTKLVQPEELQIH